MVTVTNNSGRDIGPSKREFPFIFFLFFLDELAQLESPKHSHYTKPTITDHWHSMFLINTKDGFLLTCVCIFFFSGFGRFKYCFETNIEAAALEVKHEKKKN